MIRNIGYAHSDGMVEHDDTVSELDMRRGAPLFFTQSMGSRETLVVHRGGIIVRYTAQYSDGTKERRTAVYLYFPKGHNSAPDLMFLDNPPGIRAGKRLIDRVLAAGTLKAAKF